MWMEERAEPINEERVREAAETGAGTLAVACPFCTVMLDDGVEQRPRHARGRPRDAARRVARGLTVAAIVLAGCGDDEPVGRHTPEESHAAEAEARPEQLTCGDLRDPVAQRTSQHLVIRVEFKLADEPALRRRVEAMTENRVGRSVYWAMTELCKGREASFEPGRPAVEAVRRGRYLVQPRPESWNRPP